MLKIEFSYSTASLRTTPFLFLRHRADFFAPAQHRSGFSRRHIFQTLHEPVVQFLFNSPKERARILGYVASFGQVFADLLVRVFDRPFFPRMVRMAEKYPDAQFLLKLLVPREKQVVVRRTRLPLRISFLNAPRCCMHGSDAYDIYWFKECDTEFPVDRDEQDACSAPAGDNEVEFGISEPHSLVDIPRPFVDEGPAVERRFVLPLPSGLLFLPQFCLDLPSVRAFDISVNAFF